VARDEREPVVQTYRRALIMENKWRAALGHGGKLVDFGKERRSK
jgi:hypothetical protein